MSKSDTLTQFTNCRLVRNHQLIRDDLWIRNGLIVNPEPIFFDEKALAHKKYDCKNAIIAAGYIDLQINGGYGVDFSFDTDTVEEGINKVASCLIKNGVTSFCPTLVTSPPETYRKVIPRIPKETNGAGILGIHLEGPFINSEKKGAHPENCIKNLEEGMKTVMDIYGSLDNVKILTLAPEKDFSGQIIRTLTDMGITVACGHSMGNLKDGENAVQNGASLITHLFNAMLPFHHRDPGLVGLLASSEIPDGKTVYFGLISDGVHTHPTAMRIAYRTHADGLVLVTDAISALGLEEGVHHIGQLKLEVKDSKAFIAGTDTLCGSIAPMDECVRIFKKSTDSISALGLEEGVHHIGQLKLEVKDSKAFIAGTDTLYGSIAPMDECVRIFKKSTGCSTVYAIEAATLHPAKCINKEKSKGTLDFETDADFILLDDDLKVLSTWINGKCCHSTDAINFNIF